MRHVLLSAFLVSVSLTAFAACNDDDPAPTDAEYFTELQAADAEFRDRIDASNEVDDDEAQEAMGRKAYEEFIEELKNLDPVDEAEPAHTTVLAGFEELYDLIDEALGENGNQDDEDVARALELTREISTACQELESVAEARGEQLDLLCSEGAE